MKALAIIFSFICLQAANAQSTTFGKWTIQNNDAVYTHAFEVEGDSLLIARDLKRNFELSLWVKLISTDQEIIGRLDNWKIDYRKYGNGMNTAILFRDGQWFGVFHVKIFDGGYQVVVSSLLSHSPLLDQPGGGTEWNRIALTKDRKGFRTGQSKNILYMETALTDLFTIKRD